MELLYVSLLGLRRGCALQDWLKFSAVSPVQRVLGKRVNDGAVWVSGHLFHPLRQSRDLP